MWCGATQEPSRDKVCHVDAPAPDRQAESLARRVLIWFDACAHRIVVTFANRPKAVKAYGFILFAMLSLVGMSRPAHAGAILDPIAQTFSNATTGWMQNSYNLGTNIFLSIAAVTLVYNIVSYYIAYESVMGLSALLVRSILGIALPYAILQVAPTLLNNIVGTAGQILAAVTGGSVAAPAATSTANTVSPDTIAALGIKIGWQLPTTAFAIIQKIGFQAVNPLNPGQAFSGNAHQAVVDLVLALAALISGFAVTLAFWFIAAELLIAYIEVSFVAPLGAWALGFMGSPATSSIADSYVSVIIRMMTRFLAILAMVTIAQNIANGWVTAIPQVSSFTQNVTPGTPGTQDVDLLKTCLSMVGGSLILLYIVRHISSIAGNVLTGVPSLSGKAAFNEIAPAGLKTV